MDGPAFDAIARAVPGSGSRRRALLAALGGTLGVLGVRGTAAKKKGKRKKPECPECATCPAPPNTCPQRVCCTCFSFSTSTNVACFYRPAGDEPSLACVGSCHAGEAETPLTPSPGRATMCTENFQCVRVECPVV
jgi:hypothetical protein